MDSKIFIDSYQKIFSFILDKAPGFNKNEGFARLVNYLLAKKIISLDLAKLLSEINEVRNNIINPPLTNYQVPAEASENIQKIYSLLDIK